MPHIPKLHCHLITRTENVILEHKRCILLTLKLSEYNIAEVTGNIRKNIITWIANFIHHLRRIRKAKQELKKREGQRI